MWFQGIPYGFVSPNFESRPHRWIRLRCRAAFSRASRWITDPRNTGALESFRRQQGAPFSGQPADVGGNRHPATAVATSLCEANADIGTYARCAAQKRRAIRRNADLARLHLNYFFPIS